jgi:branched-chain amino acid transport system permease protein
MNRIARLWPLLSMMLLVLLLAQVGFFGGEVLAREVTLGLINLIIVLGLYVFIGSSGVFSFCHIAFVAIGAYTTGLLALPEELKIAVLPQLPHFLATTSIDQWSAIAVGGALAGVFAIVASLPLMRLAGLPASLATFAVLMVVYVVISNWTKVTNGPQGLAGLPTDLSTGEALVVALVVLVAAYAFSRSGVGLRLRASREDEPGARSVGIGIDRERRIAFVISGVFCGLAGGLYAVFLGSFTADNFFLDMTFMTIVMLVVGGTGTLSGAVVGTAVVVAWTSLLTHLENGMDVGVELKAPAGLQEVGLALMLLVVLLVRPRGLAGGREVTWPFGRSRGPRSSSSPPVAKEPLAQGGAS